ncbi:hypothetical protein Sste5346_002190 [Sporothrix stenoceras]|uniref:Enoyl reductase (ER) domain-containing protein n=1 Tax=Sporothrix stenoceras TaxID=5173 RepID=A0ABR3ZMQ1_9PEZI
MSSKTSAPLAALPTRMKAQFLDSFNSPYVYRSVELPTISQPHDVLIKVDAASYCHTDAVLAAGKMGPGNPPSFPHIGCHEFAGTIVALSPEYGTTSSPTLHIGDRIGIPGRSFHPCTTCFECRTGPTPEDPDADPAGYSVYCPHAINNGLSGPGGFREYAVVDGRQVAPIPSGMRAVDAAVHMCAGTTIYSALKRCRLQPGQRVGIMGCGGGLGHLGLQFAVSMGLCVLGVDNQDGPLQLARDTVANSRGENKDAARIIDAREVSSDDIAQQLGKEDDKVDRGDMGLDAVIMLPESQAAFTYAIGLLRNHGRCVLVSFPEEDLRISAQDVVFRDISLIGSLVGGNRLLRETLSFAAEHDIRASVRTFPLSQLNDLVDEYHKGAGGKLVVDMSLGET